MHSVDFGRMVICAEQGVTPRHGNRGCVPHRFHRPLDDLISMKADFQHGNEKRKIGCVRHIRLDGTVCHKGEVQVQKESGGYRIDGQR